MELRASLESLDRFRTTCAGGTGTSRGAPHRGEPCRREFQRHDTHIVVNDDALVLFS